MERHIPPNYVYRQAHGTPIRYPVGTGFPPGIFLPDSSQIGCINLHFIAVNCNIGSWLKYSPAPVYEPFTRNKRK